MSKHLSSATPSSPSNAQHSADIAIIGGGPGGYVAAIRAAQLGFKVIVIEKSEMGGICLNWGCIPTKALLRSAEVYDMMKNAQEYGIQAQEVKFDLSAIVARSRQISKKLSQGIDYLMKKNAIQVIKGSATLISASSIAVVPEGAATAGSTMATVTAKHIIIATGARPRQLPSLPIDHKRIWDYRDAMTPARLPASLVIVGSGAIGMEFASFYSMLGTKVTVVEVAERILFAEDQEISDLAHKAFSKQGITIHTSSSISSITPTSVVIQDARGKTTEIPCETIISAVGIVPNSQGLGLEEVGVTSDERGHIAVDDFGATSIPGVYAIGDVANPPCLAHKASHQGIICIEKIAGHSPHPMRRENIPACTYSHPQIASIGYTEARAKELGRELGYEIKVGRFPLHGNGKALATSDEATKGIIKTIYNASTGEILGIHMLGHEVTEMVHSFALAKTGELTEEDVMHTIFPHPTISEAIHESTLAAYGRALHV